MIAGIHSKLGRAALGISQDDLAKVVGVCTPTIKRLEKDGGSNGNTLAIIEDYFRSQGLEMLRDDQGIGVRIRFHDGIPLGGFCRRTPKPRARRVYNGD